ncbi:GGDEF domain-containing protein [Sanguibacter sp. 25GB23B1]|uniref:GGDEF domain-containing protein n=1 Tax=unclassified Sanguibacter TaxID=2645534 RepID=UPI0032AEF29A
MNDDAPRRLSERGAARTLGTLIIAGVLAVTILEITAGVLGTRPVSPVVVGCTAVLLACGVIVLLAPEHLPRHLITVLTPLSIPLVVAINLATQDAGGGAQVAFVLPVVYAGAFRSARLTWWTTALAVAGVLTTTFTQLSVNQAVMDSVLVIIAMVAIASILRTGRRRQDELVAALERLASVDPLTGLATRRVLDERAAQITSGEDVRDPPLATSLRAARTSLAPATTGDEQGVGLLVLDIDHFKAVNDEHGHPAGDRVLSAVGAAVQAEVRAGDTVARLGGDEFAVLFPQIDRADLEARADAVRVAVAGVIALRGPVPVTVTVSCGAAHAAARSTGPERLYRVADAALYEAKRSGRDRVVVVDVSP